MKITNNEYDVIIRSINSLISQHLEHDSFIKEAKVLRDKLMKEYDRIAEKNIEEGMTKEEEEKREASEWEQYDDAGAIGTVA